MALLDRFLESQTERTFGHGEPPSGWTAKLYTIRRRLVKLLPIGAQRVLSYTNAMKPRITPKATRSRPRNARFSRPNGCRSAPRRRSPSPAISCRPPWAAGASFARARQGGRRARPAQCLPAPEHAGGRHAVGQLRELPLPLPWLDLRPAGQVRGRAAAGRAQGSAGAPICIWQSLAASSASGLVFFSLAAAAAPPDLGGPLPAYGGTLTTEIACNWKVCVEHLLAEHTPSAGVRLALAAAGGPARRGRRDHGAGRAAHLSAHAASDPCVRGRSR